MVVRQSCWSLRKSLYEQFYDPQLKTEMRLRVVREWGVDYGDGGWGSMVEM